MSEKSQVPEGYKRTELGVFPVEWEVVKQGDIVTFYNGRAYKLSEWEKEGTPVIRLQNLTGTGSEYYYSNLKLPSKQYVDHGDLLYMWSGSFGPHIWKRSRAIYHYHIWKIECGEKAHKLFIYYLLHNITDVMRSKMHGMAILHITKSGMENQKIPLPPHPEQQKIASILSKVDEQIEQTEQIIEKTETLKKGLMQKLLTRGIGHTKFKKTELGEIPEEWKVASLDNLAKIRRGASPRPIGDKKYFSDSGGRGWVRISDVTSAYKYLRVASQYLSELGSSKSVPVDKGDLIMSICATIGKPIIVDMSACIHDGFVLFSNLNKNIDTEFLFYVLSKNEQEFLSMKQSGTQGNLNTTIVGKTKIAVPNTTEEQQRIASILSKVDSQIQDNLKCLSRLQELKKGLMQDLLTGKVRVCV